MPNSADSSKEESFTSEEKSDKAWYNANCHCGKVKYRVLSLPLDTQEVISCNCSLCTRDGLLHIYPLRKDFVLEQGKDALQWYKPGYNKPCGEHMFCTNCGSSVFTDPHMSQPPDVVCVNVRMFKDIDLDRLKVKNFDGRKLDPPYNP